jgi:hypothetical protein
VILDDGPTPRVESCEQRSVPSTPTQDQTRILPLSSEPPQDQIKERDVSDITWSTSAELALHSLPHSDDGWTEDSIAKIEAELEEELRLALVK